jgi:hypothetical protein
MRQSGFNPNFFRVREGYFHVSARTLDIAKDWSIPVDSARAWREHAAHGDGIQQRVTRIQKGDVTP